MKTLKFKTTLLITGLIGLTGCLKDGFEPVKVNESNSSNQTPNYTLVEITEPSENSVQSNSFWMRGDCANESLVHLTGAGLISEAYMVCENSRFNAFIVFDDTALDGNQEVRATQQIGEHNAESTRNFVRDTTAPNLTIVSPSVNAIVSSNQITLTGACEDGLQLKLSGVATQAQPEAICENSSYIMNLLLPDGDGNKFMALTQTDIVSNSTTVSVTVNRDSTGPMIQFISPTAGSIFQNEVRVTGTCEQNTAVTISGDIAANVLAACPNGSFDQTLSLSAGDGVKTISASQTDQAQNTATANVSVIRDTTAPMVAIVSPPANTVGNLGLSLSGICESGFVVSIGGTGLNTPSSSDCVNGNFMANVNFSDGDGSKSISVSQTDAAGNTGTSSRDYTRDSNVPMVQFTNPPAGSAHQVSVMLIGSCEIGLIVNLAGDLLNPQSTDCSGGVFIQSVSLAGNDGIKTISASQTDVGGNMGSNSRAFIKDTTPPVVAIMSPSADTVVQQSTVLSGQCESGFSVAISGSGVTSQGEVECANNTFAATIIFTGGDGTKQVIASQTDVASNTASDERTFVRQDQPPAIDGVALYETNCQNCHGSLATSAKRNRSATQIQIAIDNNIGGMGQLSTLSPGQVAAIAAALSGNPDPDPNPMPTAANPFTCTDENAVASEELRRRNKNEILNTYAAVLPTSIYNQVAPNLAPLPEDDIYHSPGSFGVNFTDTQMSILHDAAMSVYDLLKDDISLAPNLSHSCFATQSANATCQNNLLSQLNRMIAGDQMSAEDMEGMRSLLLLGDSPADARALVVGALLQSTYVIFKVEESLSADPLTPMQSARRLSFELTDSPPDTELLSAVDNNTIGDPNVLNSQAERLIQSTSGREKSVRFVRYWMGLRDQNASVYPDGVRQGLDVPSLFATSADEFNQFIEYNVFDQRNDFTEFLVSDASFADDAQLAQVYGHAPVDNRMPASTVPATMSNRLGPFNKIDFLQYPDPTGETHPFIRGAQMREQVLCDFPGFPDPDALDNSPDIQNDQIRMTMSTAERRAYQTADPVCMACHTSLNPLGFAFEEFDSLGRFRSTERVFDSAGNFLAEHNLDLNLTVPDLVELGTQTQITSNLDFINELSTSVRAKACFVKQAYRYYKIQNESTDPNGETDDSCMLRNLYSSIDPDDENSDGSIIDMLKANAIYHSTNR